jgi:hypothetical protein
MLTATRLRLTRTQILGFRRAVQALDERLPPRHLVAPARGMGGPADAKAREQKPSKVPE